MLFSQLGKRALLLLCFLSFSILNQTVASAMDQNLQLTAEEIAWLNENKDAIRYGPNPYWPPGDYLENGEHKGIVSDYIKIFEQKLGITFQKVYYDDWESFYQGMMTGAFDLVGAVQETEERKKVFVFTEPFLTTRLAVLTRANRPAMSSLDDLNSMTVAGIRGYSSLDYVKSKYPGVKVIECDDDLTVLLKVSAGAADGAIVDYMIASYLVDKYSITNIQYSRELDFHWDLRFGINKEKSPLRSILDKVLRTIGPEERQDIYHKWVSIKLEHKPSFVERHLKIIAGFFSLILLFLLIVICFNRSLKKKVFSRTKELQKSADQLRENKEYLQAVLDSAGDAVIVNDAETGQIIDVNQRMVDLYGYSYEEALQVNFGTLSQGAPPFSQAEALAWLRKAQLGGPQTFEWLSRHKDGQTFWGEVKISSAVIGNADRFVIAVRDITQRKQIEEQLAKAQKLEALGVLAGGIAHDFNNLLFAIFGNVELACTQLKEKKVLKYLSISLNTIERARSLTQQLLTFAKGGAPIQKIAPLFPFVEETTQFALSGSNVSCSFEIPEDLWNCNYDRNQIGQVIDNLTINAQQAMPAGGQIHISAGNIIFAEGEHPLLAPGDYVRISIKDSGIGIPKELLSKIFDPFFSTKLTGHGLGLATCFSILQRHNGCIDVDSEVGKGTVFHVYLPAEKETIQGEDQKNTQGYVGSGTILVMDDDDVIRQTMADMLVAMGYSVVCKKDGQEAVDFVSSAEASGYNIVGAIFDLTIPGGMGGKEAVSEIRKMNIAMPVFVISGYAEDPIMKNPEAYGFTASLSKPFRRIELIEMIGAYIGTV